MGYNGEKTIDAAARFVQLEGGVLNYLKLMKYLYLLERYTMVDRGYSVSNDNIVSMRHGPVLSHTLDLIRDRSSGEDKDLWDEYFNKNYYDLSLRREPDFKSLSINELEIIQQLVDAHRELSGLTLV